MHKISKYIISGSVLCSLYAFLWHKSPLILMVAGVITLEAASGAEIYYTNRTFTVVEFSNQIRPADMLNAESKKLTNIVKGAAVELNTTNTYAIERNAIALGHTTAAGAWNAAVNYNYERNHTNKTFDNVGWVRGTKQVKGEWGAYLWTLRNKIAFKSSATNIWVSSNGIPVAISNVFVGSLGVYGPMSNVVDIGPDISPATNFPGEGQSSAGTYYVDITNVYYQLIIPDIWITPRSAVTCAGGSNVQYTVTGTNIPQGVTWKIIPEGVSATIQTNGDWHYAEVTPGNVGTNYKVRAASVDNTNFYDQVNLTVVKIDILETNIFVGVSNTVALHLTADSSLDAEWEIIPNLQGGAYFEGSESGTSVVVNAGSLPTNYTMKAFASVFTDCFDTCTVTVVREEFKEYAPCSGFDPTVSPAWIMVPESSNNMAKAETLPGSAASQIGFESDNTNIALVLPTTASTSPQTITVTGVTNGSTEIWAKLIQSSNLCATLGVDVKKRINKTVVIHAITEENDDVPVIPVDQGQPNQVCITAGTNGVLDSSAGGDDVTNANTIVTGSNGICESEVDGDDVPVIDIDHGQPNAICVTKGVNNFRDTNPSSDDAVNGDSIDTGDDGICNTTANAINLVPAHVPSASELEDYLNNTTWGKQANVHFTVTRSDFTVNYDLDRDGELADPWAYSTTWAEINQVTAIAKDTNINYNVYNVKVYEYPVALSDPPRAEAWIGDAHQGSTEYVTAHETGHLLGRVGHDGTTVGIDLMGASDSSASPYRILKIDWNYVNQ